MIACNRVAVLDELPDEVNLVLHRSVPVVKHLRECLTFVSFNPAGAVDDLTKGVPKQPLILLVVQCSDGPAKSCEASVDEFVELLRIVVLIEDVDGVAIFVGGIV